MGLITSPPLKPSFIKATSLQNSAVATFVPQGFPGFTMLPRAICFAMTLKSTPMQLTYT